MKGKKLLKITLASLMFLTSCELPFGLGNIKLPWEKESDTPTISDSNSDTESISESISETATKQESMNKRYSLTFANATFDYDGLPHSIYVEGAPEGTKYQYDAGNGKTDPGTYKVICKVTFEDGSKKTLSASYTINRLESVLTADSNQEGYSFYGVTPVFTLNNSEQEIQMDPIYKPGTYQVELYAKESVHYKESNHITVNLTVHEGNPLGVKFESKTVLKDGNVQELVATDIPAGYDVSYENNSGVDQGKYYAKCIVSKEGQVELTLNAILTIDNPVNLEFNEYLDEFFAEYLSGDYTTLNIFLEHPENYGIIRDEEWEDPKWYTYSSEEVDKDQAMIDIAESYAYLEAFADAPLSYEQQISYDVIDNYFGYLRTYYSPDNDYEFLADVEYITAEGGYPAYFVQYMTAYQLRCEQDIKDVISYLDSVDVAFASYITYAQDKVTAGYPLSDYTIEQMKSFLDEVSKQIDDHMKDPTKDDYYFAPRVGENIDKVTFLDDQEKQTYKDQITALVQGKFNTAIKDLSSGLDQFVGECETEGYLTQYGELGYNTFIYNLAKYLGYSVESFDINAYTADLERYMNKYSEMINDAVDVIVSDTNAYAVYTGYLASGKSIVGIDKPEDMIPFLKEFAKTIVADLSSDLTVDVKYMDESAAKLSNAVAYYTKSALDCTANEYITLNPLKTGSDLNDTLLTMAHEGYPGHLYAYNYVKESGISNIATIMTNTSHGEGWATYVEHKLLEYMSTHNVLADKYQAGLQACLDYLEANTVMGFLLYTYIDLKLYTDHWGVEEIGKYMDKMGYNSDYAEEIYRTLLECPGNYACYGYGQVVMLELHERAQNRLGLFYDEIEFNKVVLEAGWCPLEVLEAHVNQYINDQCFLHNLSLK